MDVRDGPCRRLSTKELVLLNCGAGEDLRVPWTARRSNQSILKEISPGCSLEELMLKLQYFGHLMGRADSLEKTLMLGKIEGRRKWQPTPVFLPGESQGRESLVGCLLWGHTESDTTEVT